MPYLECFRDVTSMCVPFFTTKNCGGINRSTVSFSSGWLAIMLSSLSEFIKFSVNVGIRTISLFQGTVRGEVPERQIYHREMNAEWAVAVVNGILYQVQTERMALDDTFPLQDARCVGFNVFVVYLMKIGQVVIHTTDFTTDGRTMEPFVYRCRRVYA